MPSGAGRRALGGQYAANPVDSAKRRGHFGSIMTSLVHATCVLVDGCGLLLRGPSGSGKSDLAVRLIDQGATLVGDDYCRLEVRGGRLFAACAPTLAGLLEVRGLGLVRLPHATEAPVTLVADLLPPTAQADRLPPVGRMVEVLGVAVAAVEIEPFAASAAARLRLALRVAAGAVELGA